MVEQLSSKQGTADQKSAAPSASGDVVVSVRGLTKVFKDFWGRPKARAVNDVSFDIKRGQIFGLLGPNGSGKSTTVKILLGLLYPTKGHVEVFGHSPRHVQTKSRIGYLPEESYLYRYLDSRETVDFFGSLFDLPKDERRRRTEQLLEMVGLKNVQRRTVGEFSKGMQRRIGLAQALINDPDLVILDEPTAGLDPIGCREVKDLILALAARGKTVILSSHLLSDVQDVCDQVVIYYGGKIQAQGTMNELLSEPDSLQITVPALSREAMDRVLQTMKSVIAEKDIHLDTPTQDLESYFLKVVEKARSTDAATSGATSGNQVAEYLRGESTADRGARILERLARPDAPAEVESPKPTEEEIAREKEQKANQKLGDLTRRDDVPAEQAAPAPDPAKVSRESIEKANEKLSGLLGKKEPEKKNEDDKS
jgi:ABC-2 type transport system ATP-binding protein